MKKLALIDTDILSLFLRNHPQVISNFQAYLAEHDTIRFSIITYYEIVSGLRHRDTKSQLASFLALASHSLVEPLSEESVSKSATVYASMRKAGTPVDDIDLLIAGTALANDLVLVTHNIKHFSRIDGLQIEDWSEQQ